MQCCAVTVQGIKAYHNLSACLQLCVILMNAKGCPACAQPHVLLFKAKSVLQGTLSESAGME